MSSIRAPAEIAWLVDIVGERAALRLIEAHAGTRLHIPVQVRAGSPLARAVGLEPARRLAEQLQPGNWRVPAAKRWRVRLYRAEGMTFRAIALKVGLDESTAQRYARDVGASTQQFELLLGHQASVAGLQRKSDD